jgi:hypothetical protein
VEGFLSIPGKIEKDMQQSGELRAGPYLALAGAVGLLVLGALRLRVRMREARVPTLQDS